MIPRFGGLVRCGQLFALMVALFPPQAVGHGDLHERIERVQMEIKADPNNAQLHWVLAQLFLEHGDWSSASEQIGRVNQLAPGTYPTDFVQAKILAGAQQFAEARRLLDDFLIRNPGHTMARLDRARLLERLGQEQNALADYAFLVRSTTEPEPDWMIEAANAFLKARDPLKALQILDQGLLNLGQVPALVSRAVEIELLSRDVDAALARIQRAQEAAPRPEPWMAKRAAILAQAGRAEASRVAWNDLVVHLEALSLKDRSAPGMQAISVQAHRALEALEERKLP